MKYISTRGKAPVLNFEEAMLTGLARDGGLYVPQSIPNFSPDDISSMSDLSYEEIAFKVILPFVGDCFSDDELIKIINKAYTEFGHIERAPLVELESAPTFCLAATISPKSIASPSDAIVQKSMLL